MQTIYLDVSNKGVVPTVYAKQGDVGRKFQVVLTDSGLPYVPASGSAFSVWYSGASGDGNYTDIGDKSAFTVNENKVVVEMISQMLLNYGDGVLSLALNDPNGNQISTWNIPYFCETVPGAESEEAKSYYTAFSQAVENLPYPDDSLSVAGKAADSAAVGVALANKAPAGYGLGKTSNENMVTSTSALDALKVNCNFLYASDANPIMVGSVGISYAYGRVDADDGIRAKMTIVPVFPEYKSTIVRYAEGGGTWGEWEWENPPMEVGVEYRTTERHNGKAVYTKAFNTGEMTNGGNFEYTTEIVTPIRVSAEVENHTLPYYGGGDLVGGIWSIWFDVTGNTFTARFGSGMTTVTYRVQVWYVNE